MKKNKISLYLLALLMVGIKNQAVGKDPFQPFDLSQCTSFVTQLNGWKLNAVLTSTSSREAVISHTLLGTRRVALGSQPSFINGRVTQIQLTHIEISVLPPCPSKRVTLYFKGAS